MITPRDIVLHLAEYLPRITDLFSDSISISQAVVSSGHTITVDTTSAHGLIVGSPVLFIGGKTANTIASIVDEVADETALIEFDDVHDFTTPNETIQTEPLPCVGFDQSEWNVTLDIIDVPTDKEVIVRYPSGATGIPTFTPGDAIGYEERPLSIFGTQEVSSIPTTTQFVVTLDSTKVPALPDGEILNLSATTSVRIAAADNVERADAIYTEQVATDDLWAFVIMTDTDVSKDRHTVNDSIASFTHQNEMRLKVLQNFSVVVYFKSADHISGATAQEIAHGTVYRDLLRVLYGFGGFATDEDGSDYVTVTVGHGAGTSNVAYYTEVYDWQTPVDITVDNGFNFYEDVAFRKLNASWGMFTADNEEKLTLAINLEP